MGYKEAAVVFDCAGEQLVGVATLPQSPQTVGVLILVGGRQYRAGSHRQFVQLARRVASADFCAFRFDYRGMGDSSGAMRSFEDVDADIAAAIAAFQVQCPAVRRVVLWGLCDAATAAVLYCRRARDPRVAGLCLVNPWLRSEMSLARARVRHYYRDRILDPAFWRKLLRGQIGPMRALAEYFGAVRTARSGELPGFQRAMLDGMAEFSGPLLLLLSGRDLTAREFLDHISEDAKMVAMLQSQRVMQVGIADADHTFSRDHWTKQAEDAVLAWLPQTGKP